MKKLIKKLLLLFIIVSPIFLTGFKIQANNVSNDFILYQLPIQGKSQMMSYAIKTQNHLIIIDGGTHNETAYLKNFIKQNGGIVNMWITTHPHVDHAGALADILMNPSNIKINAIYQSLPERSWILKFEPSGLPFYDSYLNALNKSKVQNSNIKLRQKLIVDGVIIDFLSVKNSEITKNALNNSSLVFKVTSSRKTVLFLGDAGVEEGNKILETVPKTVLKSKYVQMAHHGQRGVSEQFYKTVCPEYCLWPTPKWLWENNPGTGYNTGKWKTLEVRTWVKCVKGNYVSFTGLIVIK